MGLSAEYMTFVLHTAVLFCSVKILLSKDSLLTINHMHGYLLFLQKPSSSILEPDINNGSTAQFVISIERDTKWPTEPKCHSTPLRRQIPNFKI